ncbi:hypothetical protein BKA69DRAFT_1120804 [Paraphysoderma sedebokerense]|nr:hypothetical protein BKA69DRAFT_1120804 [Paraphysoderma sedebokerense]
MLSSRLPPSSSNHQVADSAFSRLYEYILKATILSDFYNSGMLKEKDQIRRKAEALAESLLSGYVRRIFGTSEKYHETIVKTLKYSVNQESYFQDLKLYLDLVEKGEFRSPASDFESRQHFESWISNERKDIVSILSQILEINPKIKHAKCRSGDTASTFYIPAEANEYYRAVLEKCLEMDKSLGPCALSSMSSRLLECIAVKWRVNLVYRKTLYLKIALDEFGKSNSNWSLLHTSIKFLETLSLDNFGRLTGEERFLLHSVLSSVMDTLINRLRNYNTFYTPSQFSAVLDQTLNIVCSVSTLISQIYGEPTLSMSKLMQLIGNTTQRRYIELVNEPALYNQPVLQRTLSLIDLIQSELDRITAFTSKSSFNLFSIPDTSAFFFLQMLFHEIDNWWHVPPSYDDNIGYTLTCYNKLMLMNSYLESRQNKVPSNIVTYQSNVEKYRMWFSSAVDSWIQRTSEMLTERWTNNAIDQDNFEPIEGKNYSTSVTDLFTSFHQQITVAVDLPWPSFSYKYRIVKQITKTISFCVQAYANQLQSAILNDILQLDKLEQADFPDSPSSDRSPTEKDEQNLVSRFQKVFSKEKKEEVEEGCSKVGMKIRKKLKEPVMFKKETIVMLNNIHASKLQIDDVYARLSESVTEDVTDWVSPFRSNESLIKILITDIIPMSTLNVDYSGFYIEFNVRGTAAGQSDWFPFQPHQSHISANIDWSFAVDVPVLTTESVHLSAYTVDSEGKQICLGIGVLHLDARNLRKTRVAEETIRLTNGWGNVDVRIENAESDYIYYWFNDAYEKLGVMEDNNMLMFVTQLSNYTMSYLTALIKKYKPIPAADGVFSKFLKPNIPSTVTLESVDKDIKYLIDYLDASLAVLNGSLDENISGKLFKKLWGRIIKVIETLAVNRISKKTGKRKLLKGKQVDVVKTALSLLKSFFHADGEGVPLTDLETSKFLKVSAIIDMYSCHPETLISKYQNAFNAYISLKMEQAARKRSLESVHRNGSIFSDERRNRHADYTLPRQRHRTLSSEHATVESSANRSSRPLPPLKVSTQRHHHPKPKFHFISTADDSDSDVDLDTPPSPTTAAFAPSASRLSVHSTSSDTSQYVTLTPPRTPSPGPYEPSESSTQQHVSKEATAALACQDAIWALLDLFSDHSKVAREFMKDQEERTKQIVKSLLAMEKEDEAMRSRPLPPLPGQSGGGRNEFYQNNQNQTSFTGSDKDLPPPPVKNQVYGQSSLSIDTAYNGASLSPNSQTGWGMKRTPDSGVFVNDRHIV